MLKKIFKWIGFTLLAINLLVVVIGAIFMNTSPEFGGEATNDDIERYKKSGHYKDGIFVNEVPTSMDMSFSKMMGTMADFIKGVENSVPNSQLKIEKTNPEEIINNSNPAQLLWFGHSTLLLKMEGQNIILDPMLGLVPAPNPLLGGERYSKELPVEISLLPEIDAVVISHDHYDHLDYGTVIKLKDKTKVFYVPLGVGAHLKEWGVEPSKIKELNWWDSAQMDRLSFVLTPSRHFSGRGLTDRSKTLWGSWVIKSEKETVYFSGDGGYGPHFKKIGEKYGPFDIAFIECGQYNEKWRHIHMFPEESAQAGADLKAKVIMPIHWAAFSLSLHSWTDPVERILIKAKELDLPVATPKIGELIVLDSLVNETENWWSEFNNGGK